MDSAPSYPSDTALLPSVRGHCRELHSSPPNNGAVQQLSCLMTRSMMTGTWEPPPFEGCVGTPLIYPCLFSAHHPPPASLLPAPSPPPPPPPFPLPVQFAKLYHDSLNNWHLGTTAYRGLCRDSANIPMPFSSPPTPNPPHPPRRMMMVNAVSEIWNQ